MSAVSRGRHLNVTKISEDEQQSPEELLRYFWLTLSFKHEPYGLLRDYLKGEGFAPYRGNNNTGSIWVLRTWNRSEALKTARSIASWTLSQNHERKTISVHVSVQPMCLQCFQLLSFGACVCDFCGSEFIQPKGKVRLSDGKIFFNGKKKREVAE